MSGHPIIHNARLTWLKLSRAKVEAFREWVPAHTRFRSPQAPDKAFLGTLGNQMLENGAGPAGADAPMWVFGELSHLRRREGYSQTADGIASGRVQFLHRKP